jgi:hypothetical protein
METPTLEQVKEYFKNAKIIESTLTGDKVEIDHSKEFLETNNGFYCYDISDGYDKEIFDKETNTYAEIISFIDPSTYTLPKTELQVLKEKYAIAKTTLEAVLFYIVPDDCRTMVSQALDELNGKKPK